MLSIPQLKSYLLHPWQFKRTITHHADPQIAQIEGTLTFFLITKSDDQCRYLYCEKGVISQGAYAGPIEQTYEFLFKPDGLAQVYFKNGGFFYCLDLTLGQASITHQCGDDTYLGQVEVHSQTQHQYIWHVKGPRKNYTSHTIFSRISH